MKLSLLCAYISIYKIGIICLSETYLDSSISCDDVNLELIGYNLVRSDNPTNTKRGGVYNHNSLPLKVIDIHNFELTLDTIINKNTFLIVALGDFSAKAANWYKNDINSYEGLKIDTITANSNSKLI